MSYAVNPIDCIPHAKKGQKNDEHQVLHGPELSWPGALSLTCDSGEEAQVQLTQPWNGGGAVLLTPFPMLLMLVLILRGEMEGDIVCIATICI